MKKNFILSLCILALVSCKKDSELSPSPSIIGKWLFTSYISEEKVVDIPDCSKDDYLVFSESKVVEASTGSALCEPEVTELQELNKATYTISSDNKKLIFTLQTGEVMKQDILELSAKTLKFAPGPDEDIWVLTRQ